MAKRYYLLLIFQSPKKDKLEPYGDDLSKASETFDTLRQQGGPDGIVAATIITSTGRVVKHAPVFSKAWHAEQARRAREESSTPAGGHKERISDPPPSLTPEQRIAALRAKQLEIEAELLELGVDPQKGASDDSSTGSQESKASDGSDDPANPQTSLV